MPVVSDSYGSYITASLNATSTANRPLPPVPCRCTRDACQQQRSSCSLFPWCRAEAALRSENCLRGARRILPHWRQSGGAQVAQCLASPDCLSCRRRVDDGQMVGARPTMALALALAAVAEVGTADVEEALFSTGDGLGWLGIALFFHLESVPLGFFRDRIGPDRTRGSGARVPNRDRCRHHPTTAALANRRAPTTTRQGHRDRHGCAPH